jgi:hypothetical protein
MATPVRVSCITKTRRPEAHDRISHIGGVNADGSQWQLPESQAIRGIEDDRWDFYVERPTGHRVRVIVATRQGHKYLKTVADGEQPDNLLSLPECPNLASIHRFAGRVRPAWEVK